MKSDKELTDEGAAMNTLLSLSTNKDVVKTYFYKPKTIETLCEDMIRRELNMNVHIKLIVDILYTNTYTLYIRCGLLSYSSDNALKELCGVDESEMSQNLLKCVFGNALGLGKSGDVRSDRGELLIPISYTSSEYNKKKNNDKLIAMRKRNR